NTSDAIGETAELVARAGISQFNPKQCKNELLRYPYIESFEDVDEVIQVAKDTNAFSTASLPIGTVAIVAPPLARLVVLAFNFLPNISVKLVFACDPLATESPIVPIVFTSLMFDLSIKS
ncbi:kinase/pyrophosphorylase, partial [Salmonella enterica subsp. enterica serovar Corvallis]|nr:kinase/pyrophosphorylase [Salmonella enterica subsp. enterica serovar Corvallis]